MICVGSETVDDVLVSLGMSSVAAGGFGDWGGGCIILAVVLLAACAAI